MPVDYNHRQRARMGAEAYDQYCKRNKEIDNNQQVLDEAVVEINRRITELNKKNNVPTTWLSTVVHSYYRGKHHHNYKRLRDGCHPDEVTKKKWGKLIIKSVRNIQRENGNMRREAIE